MNNVTFFEHTELSHPNRCHKNVMPIAAKRGELRTKREKEGESDLPRVAATC